MERSQFTFYESFYKALSRIRKDGDRAKAYDTIVRFALYGEEPDVEALPDNVAVAFELVRPIAEASRRKAENGKKGGTSKREATRKQTEANAKQTEANRKQEKEQVQVQVQDKEQMLIYSLPPTGGREYIGAPAEARGNGKQTQKSAACDAFMAKINPTPSSGSMLELLEFERTLGPEVCLRAIDTALDANAPSWNYVRGVLNRCKEQGITSLAEWDRQEAQRMNSKRKRTAQAEPEADPGVDTSDLDRIWEEMQGGGTG